MRLEELTAEQLLMSIWTSLRRIETNMALPPAPLELPAINVAPPDLSDIVTAVTSLNGTGPTADDIARAIVAALPPSGTGDEALRQVAEGLKLLDHRLQGFGKQAYGGGSVSMAPGQTIGVAGSVEITNDIGSPIPVRQSGATDAIVTRVAASLTAVTLLTTDTNRAQAIVYNETTAALYVKLGTGAAITDYTIKVAGSGGYFEVPIRYLGPVSGVWDAATGYAQVTEF